MPVSAPTAFEYRRGTIVSIEVWNFVTYEHAAVYPNSRLNLVIGPNGSGKSSIVCAMCLGLGGSPRLLERGDSAKDYIRHGETEALIQIKLATGEGKNVVLIERKIITDEDREKGTDKWAIDGKLTNLKAVKEIVKAFHIQLENYTQFLPQDVVKMFPALTPVQLLERTQAALGDTTLLDKHKQLIELKKAGGTEDRQFEALEDELLKNRDRHEKLRREAEKFQERQELQKRVDAMRKREPSLVYEIKLGPAKEMKALYDSKKAETKAKLKQYDKLKPPVEKLKKERTKMKEKEQKLKTDRRRKEKQHEQWQNSMEEKTEQIDQEESKIDRLQKDWEKEQNKIAELQQEASVLHEQVNAAGGDLEGLKKQKASLSKESQQLSRDKYKADEEFAAANRECRRKRVEIEQLKSELQEVQNAETNLLRELTGESQNYRFGNDSWLTDARRLIKEKQQQNQFKFKVYGPLALDMKVRNPDHARMVERAVGRDIRKAFITQCVEDRELLEKLKAQNNWKSIYMINFVVDPTKVHQSPVPLGPELKRLGVTHYIRDMIDADQLILDMLCDMCKINQIAYGDSSVDKNRDKIFQAGIRILFSPSNVYNVKKSVHTHELSTTIVPMQKEAHVFNKAVDEARQQQIIELGQKLEGQLGALGEKAGALHQEKQNVEKDCADLQRQLDAVQSKMQQIGALKRKLQSKKEQIARREASVVDPAVERETIRREVAKLNRARLKILQQFVSSMKAASALAREHDTASLRHASMTQRLSAAENELREFGLQVDAVHEEFELVKEKWAEMKSDLSKAKASMERVEAEITPEIREMWQQLPSNLNDLRETIRTEQAKADSLVTDGSALREYERISNQIKILEVKYEQQKEARAGRDGKIAELEQQWLPKLRDLIEKVDSEFRQSMEEMGFAGEVLLDEDSKSPRPSYENFSIQIRVRFKQDQKIRNLDKHAQSGGEKSVSTMLYLVALQNMTTFPFRVVDEINQGMDARNERKMFEQIVRAASREDVPQYFVITPKLLPALAFNDAVKVHLVWNGPAIMPQEVFEDSKHCTINTPTKRKGAGEAEGCQSLGRPSKRAALGARN